MNVLMNVMHYTIPSNSYFDEPYYISLVTCGLQLSF